METKFVLMLVGCVIISNAFAIIDPTQPVSLEAGGHVTIIQDGTKMVLVSPDRKIAFVDGAYVTVGDHVKSGEVVSITDGGVEVLDLKKGKISMLTITGELIKIKSFSSMDNSGNKVN